jgi:hypothetical protein
MPLHETGINAALANASRLQSGTLAANHSPEIRTGLLEWAVVSLPNLEKQEPYIGKGNMVKSMVSVWSGQLGIRKTRSITRSWKWRRILSV